MKALFIACCLLASSAFGAVITFDDLPTAGCGGTPIPNGYRGFTWNNFFYDNATVGTCATSGYATALTSSPDVGFNGAGDPASIVSATPFLFLGADLAAAWNDGLTFSVVAKNGGLTVGMFSFTLDTTHKIAPTFNFGPITELDFSSSGGTPNPNFAKNGSGTQFAVDNLTISTTPEPTTFTLILLFPAALCVALRRRPSDMR